MARKFEKVSLNTFHKYFDNYPLEITKRIYDAIKLPIRKTKQSAGYDFFSPITIVLEPNDSFLVPTGIKAYMNEGEFLAIFIRSSLGIKKNIVLKNGTGIIDKDYVDNIDNEGHILISIKNTGPDIITINAGEGIAQGIFLPYLLTDNDNTKAKRVGGIGSTNTNVELEKAKVKDAHELLAMQKESFKSYIDKYGKFDTNPYYMTLHRIEFNIKYRFGDYQKIIYNGKLVGAIFAFALDESNAWKIAQLYVLPEYEGIGIGSLAIEEFFKLHNDVKEWYADTINEEKQNLDFYKSHGFVIIDIEEERQGLSFATLVRK